jgi:hypothetical protein
MIDFDEIDDWAPELSDVLSQWVPRTFERRVADAAPEYVEDALDLLFESAGRDAVIDATLAWICSSTVAGYHGSRLSDEEVESVRSIGLIPLQAETRRDRLVRALSPHPRWREVADRLTSVLQNHGPGGAAGRREGQAHLTLSRCGLVDGFNHYLTHGSEFDQHAAHELLGADGKELLAKDGKPTVLRVAVPGPRALDAAHPHFGVDDMRTRGEVPNLVREFLEAWSYKLAHPAFRSRTLKVDCGMVFRSTIPAAWIVGIATVVE